MKQLPEPSGSCFTQDTILRKITLCRNKRKRSKIMSHYITISHLPARLNIRDLGGLPAHDGRHVRKGLIFRSSALAFFTEEELFPVKKLGLKTILDLRSESGASKRPDPLLEGAAYYNRCAAFQNFLDDLNSPAELASLVFDGDQKGNPADVLVSSYSASLAFSNEAFRFMFESLLEGRAPLLFHCSNGKDRTGVAAMLILLALGVEEGCVKEDFLRSNESRKEEIDRLLGRFRPLSGLSATARSFLTMIGGVLPESADMMISEILERYGTYENFMEKEYGFDGEKLRKFRDMYLE